DLDVAGLEHGSSPRWGVRSETRIVPKALDEGEGIGDARTCPGILLGWDPRCKGYTSALEESMQHADRARTGMDVAGPEQGILDHLHFTKSKERSTATLLDMNHAIA